MRSKYTIAIACALGLSLGVAACVTPGGSLGANITNDLSLACTSAKGLLSLPAAQGATGKLASFAASLNVTVAKDCNKAVAVSTAVQPLVDEVNTIAALALGAGIAL